jgi:myo-inositol-1(or 4)-monophosphatase
MNSISPNLNLMIKACEKASKVIIRDFGEIENLQVSRKGPKDFVTKTDKRVEKILIEELDKSKKNYSFVTEETGKILNKNRSVFWIIDPIDGTTNFLHGIPHFAISIALQIENEIVIGLVVDPIKDEIFYAEKNNGSFINNNRIRVSSKSNIEECLFASNNDGIKSVHPKLNLRNSGCAALDMAYVGCGRLDGFKVEMTDGTIFETKSTWGSENDILKLEIDPKSHSAWTGGKQKILDKGRISKFNKKFQNYRSEKK